jgi:hypothetical protein
MRKIDHCEDNQYISAASSVVDRSNIIKVFSKILIALLDELLVYGNLHGRQTGWER